jgi:hypothetical protein
MTDHPNPVLALDALEAPKPATVFDMNAGLVHDGIPVAQEIETCLRERGFCVLRDLFTQEHMAEVSKRADTYLSKPAIAGAPGYWKVDHPKKLLNPFTLGGSALDLLLDERIIDIVERSMAGECILAETMLKFDRASPYTYFPLHSDFAVGWSKSDKILRKLKPEDLHNVIGIGGALYLHDTAEGAFCYCDATHHLMSPRGQRLDQYPKAEQRAILARKIRCDGQRGDLVLFDDRGFHGPDQPSKADRTVILLDYFRVETIGRLQVSPMPIWSTDIARLTEKQLRVAGAGADCMVDPTEYTHTRFRRNALYSLIAWAVSKAYIIDHIKSILKNLVRRPQ